VEIVKNCRQTFEWDEMISRYVISLSKFKLEEQLRFTAKVNTMHISRLQNGLNAIMRHIEDKKLGHLQKKKEMCVYYSVITFSESKKCFKKIFCFLVETTRG